MMLPKPMLAGTIKNVETDVKFPCLVSPKLDGIRMRIILINGIPTCVSRTNKPIPNKAVQAKFGKIDYLNFDGELIVGEPTDSDVFNKTTSVVMSHDKSADDVTFFVFDYINDDSYINRHSELFAKCEVHKSLLNDVQLLDNGLIQSIDELLDVENTYLLQGFEGVMVRSYDGKYKQGRSTVKEGYLLKLKRFSDSEAVIIGYEELMTNDNQAYINETGHSERSIKKEGLVPADTLGSLLVRDINTGVEFSIGSGFNDKIRAIMWYKIDSYIGQIITYKFFDVGVKDKPRFPIFKGFRSVEDM